MIYLSIYRDLPNVRYKYELRSISPLLLLFCKESFVLVKICLQLPSEETKIVFQPFSIKVLAPTGTTRENGLRCTLPLGKEERQLFDCFLIEEHRSMP